MIENRQHHGFQDHALGERAADRQDGGAGKVQLALAVTVDVAGEAVVAQPLDGVGVEKLRHDTQLIRAESEAIDGVENALGAGHDAVSAAAG